MVEYQQHKVFEVAAHDAIKNCSSVAPSWVTDTNLLRAMPRGFGCSTENRSDKTINGTKLVKTEFTEFSTIVPKMQHVKICTAPKETIP